MNTLKRAIHFMLVVTYVLSASVFYGCGADSLGPYVPLLPTIESEAKFSSRYQLEEEPQFFYDLYGIGLTQQRFISREILVVDKGIEKVTRV